MISLGVKINNNPLNILLKSKFKRVLLRKKIYRCKLFIQTNNRYSIILIPNNLERFILHRWYPVRRI